MNTLPLPLRVAAGLAATAVERARDLPTRLAGLPVTVVSQALQASMRVQQHVTELAIKGDEVLAALRPVEEKPEWATFDEDVDDTEGADGHYRPPFDRVADDADADAAESDDFVEVAQDDPAAVEELWDERRGPESLPNYHDLSLAQLRARLRGFTVETLEELLAHERAGENRPQYVTMLTRRIATVRDAEASATEEV
ncbi:lipid droplet-associated protein [Actinokineospora auranticolor]|uniref:DUF8129 domain-containing protein n=1 Tax=Actinokineospora auranticolor TaxID=155976 RepID=A0A2S6GYI0_9PSEU|nr:lipid droplet-associated protein [Actinokineospora auranticolor]PPK70220.1 hypothetical protein CLV40_102131 [Actinokineospora auranticolor]